jgi:hypothetical protein
MTAVASQGLVMPELARLISGTAGRMLGTPCLVGPGPQPDASAEPAPPIFEEGNYWP